MKANGKPGGHSGLTSSFCIYGGRRIVSWTYNVSFSLLLNLYSAVTPASYVMQRHNGGLFWVTC